MKNILLQYPGQFQSVMTGIAKRLEKRGLNSVELVALLAQPENESVLDKVADILAEAVSDAKSALKNFFTANNSISFSFGDNFKNWLLSKEFKYAERKGNLLKRDLPRNMADEEIFKEFKIQPYSSISEGLSEIRDLLEKQSKGNKGELLVKGYWNIFYVKLEDGETVVVFLSWHSDIRDWDLFANRLGVGKWHEGHRVFFRS